MSKLYYVFLAFIFVGLIACVARQTNNQYDSVEIVDSVDENLDTISFEIDTIPRVDTLVSDSVVLRAEGAKFGWVDIDVWITNKHSFQINCLEYSTHQIVGNSTKFLIGGEMECTIGGGKKKKNTS